MGYLVDKGCDHTFFYRRLPPVFSRDFAYANNAPVVLRMARANIANTTARSFAEYVKSRVTPIS